MKVLYSFYIVGYLWDIFIHGCHKCVKSHFCALGCPVVVGLIENLRGLCGVFELVIWEAEVYPVTEDRAYILFAFKLIVGLCDRRELV